MKRLRPRFRGGRSIQFGVPLGLVFVSATASAIVNIEDQRDDDGADGASGAARFSVSGDSGNSDRSDIAAGLRLFRRQRGSESLLLADYSYGESQGVKNSNRSFLHARYGATFRPGTMIEGFGQIEKDDFARLQFRGLAGMGLRFLRRGDTTRSSLGIGVFHSWERLTEALPGERRDERLWRANLYFSIDRKLETGLTLHSSTYLQPRIGPVGDFRLLEQFACSVPVTEMLDLRLSLDILHDSRPPLTVKRTDMHYRTTLEVRF